MGSSGRHIRYDEEWEHQSRQRRRRKRRRRERMAKLIFAGGTTVLLVLFLFLLIRFPGKWIVEKFGLFEEPATLLVEAPDYDVQLLTPNEYSRPQIASEPITGIVIHYTANPGTTAQNNRDYFEGLKDSHLTKTSSHFIIGLEGEIIQCIPTKEVAYASNERNSDTVSIETCYINEDGSYEQATYDSLVHLTAWLMGKFNLKIDSVIRHYDVTGKLCPLYFVEHEDAWEQFKQDVSDYIEANGEKPPKNTEDQK